MPDKRIAAEIRAALGRGDLLSAYDLARHRPNDQARTLDYLEVLTLARLGDIERALKLYEAYDLSSRDDVDTLSLKARLLKDAGFNAKDGPARALLEEACELYLSIYRRTGDSYPAINAATLARIVGRRPLAAQLARAAITSAEADPAPGYYTFVTIAEASLVLDDVPGARKALDAALEADDIDAGKRSTTVLQMQRLAPALGGGYAIECLVELIAPAGVLVYSGPTFVGSKDIEAALAAKVSAVLENERIGFAYGCLAAGSDILLAEQLLAKGVELHVVLPVTEADFRAHSVAPAGQSWVERFEACRAAATSITFASTMSHVGGQGQFAYGSNVVMGMARLRARHLNTRAVQLAISESSDEGVLQRSDIRVWQETGGRSLLVDAPPFDRPLTRRADTAAPDEVSRGVHGLMFTDFPGFARLDERVLPLFQTEVMARSADVLARHAPSILHRNTWGDALYIVFADVLATANAALDLCDSLRQVDTGALGARTGAAMRIALHFGPTYSGIDPVTERTTYYGSEVARAARIEPVTPPGSVYVTEPFAAILAMEPGHDLGCEYVGQVELPKGYGTFPLYRLRRS
jgi:adenylate cyclase